MAGLYPNDTFIGSNGECDIGLVNGKYSNGSVSPSMAPTRLPAEQLNLWNDLLGDTIKAGGLIPNNTDTGQLTEAIKALAPEISPPPPPYRNRIINGDFSVNQYAVPALIPASSLYIIDRWVIGTTQANKLSWSRGGRLGEGVESLKITTTTAFAALANDYFRLGQACEGQVMQDLNWGNSDTKIILSFIVEVNNPGNYSGCIQNYAKTYSYPFQFNVPVANMPVTVTITIPAPPQGSLWGTGNTGWGYLIFDLGSGSGKSASTSGQWLNGDVSRVNGTINLTAIAGATLQISNVQLEIGTVVTPFEFLPYDVQLQRCQRYYITGSSITAPGSSSWGNNFFKVSMRAIPTVSLSGAITATVGGISVDSFILSQGGNSGSYTANAEL